MLLFIFPVRVVVSGLLCVCVCGRNPFCVNADQMPKSRSEGDREGKGLRFYLSFMCVFLYLKSWTMLMLEEICNLRKDGVRKITMSNVQSPGLPSSFPTGPDEGRQEGTGKLAGDTLLL